MVVVFFDRENWENPNNGTAVGDAAHLVSVLAALAGQPPFFFELECSNGRKLLVGHGDGVGCAQFTDEEGLAAVAVSPTPARDEVVEFLMGGTATPVLPRYCMPLSLALQIAEHFVRTGNRSAATAWEVA
jgi:hypothetical protein